MEETNEENVKIKQEESKVVTDNEPVRKFINFILFVFII